MPRRPSALYECIFGLALLASLSSARAEQPHPEKPAAAPKVQTTVTPTIISQPAERRLPDVERIARLQRSVQSDEQRLAELRSTVNSPTLEFQKAESEFNSLDAELNRKRKELAKLPTDSPEAEKLKAAVEAMESEWKLAKERYALAVEERRALRENIATREQKLRKDRDVLERLTGAKPLDPGPTAVQENVPQATVVVAPAEAPKPEQPVAPTVPAVIPAATPPTQVQAAVTQGLSQPAKPASTAPTAAKRISKELEAATAEAQKKVAVAQKAANIARSITERTELLRKSIAEESALLETQRKKADNAYKTLGALQDEFDKKFLAGTDPKELQALRQRIAETEDRLQAAQLEVRTKQAQLDTFRSDLDALQADQIAALKRARYTRKDADIAEEAVAKLQNPFAVRNVLQWLLDHAPRMITIFISALGFLALSRVFETRIINVIARRSGHGTPEERENRAKTLAGVVHSAANMVVVGGGILMVLDEVGIPVAPLMGGAAVIGLAAAFGAQNLIKDFFSGFMILLEQQYMVNDVVKIGDISGQVERISMRITVLRDLEGQVHFVPHGQITSVTNMTHGWSRAVFAIAVAYREDVDRVMEVLLALGRELRRDPAYAPLILEDPEMLGVDDFGESAVTVKFVLKTRPLKQWMIKRELLRRIKNRFDELGIEIPFPHRTLIFRQEDKLQTAACSQLSERAA